MSLTVAQEMAHNISTLESTYSKAQEVHASTWYFPFAGSSTSVDGALTQARKSIDALKGSLRDDVLAGRKNYTVWQLVAEGANDSMRTVLLFVPSLSFGSVSGDIARDLATTTIDSLKIGTYWILPLVVAAIVALAVIKVKR
jgi:hypothetical protein